MTTRQAFDQELEELSRKIFNMGMMVQERVGLAIVSLSIQDMELANEVITGDLKINDLQAEIEEKSILLIARQQPIATDLRKIVAGFKIAMHLERIGDLAADIAKVTIRIGNAKLIKPLIDIPQMGKLVGEMIVKGLDAYAQVNAEKAQEMSLIDEEIDHLYGQIFRELLVFLREDSSMIDQATYLILVGRFLERMGDYCTNIGEEIVYIATGKRTDLNS
ncbi:phosphate signaling complex protein PhoU [Desulfosporosinus sp. BICA1-9]|uniref:phosphate signaling complex protein PhoU n=1 Tax=Desulfosporosinus sp. BICA1-9 TaxID=1531958 RepID=UPI00054C4044|nr:phosphate signaling complex protein PhoU [Desulfosporosinus sp. BICA1-9]KJS47755.1 MAG: PhoU family transcriptional regulator [Peptococcaceae bacterium BRH_c23]KJS88476.1 MAG: PhoU family transcriptional regulator [Desulfosporosinus sp. BICA1-9]HBW34677.1 phosphate transport system regulatory protein PhoU [Desulfosporosinus sp.]